MRLILSWIPNLHVVMQSSWWVYEDFIIISSGLIIFPLIFWMNLSSFIAYLFHVLQVNVRRPVHENVKDGDTSLEKVSSSSTNGIPIVRKSKLLIVDLAGSERVDKSGLLLIYLIFPSNLLFPFNIFWTMDLIHLFLRFIVSKNLLFFGGIHLHGIRHWYY